MMLSYACHECGKTFHRYRLSGPDPRYCGTRCRKRAQRRRDKMLQMQIQTELHALGLCPQTCCICNNRTTVTRNE